MRDYRYGGDPALEWLLDGIAYLHDLAGLCHTCHRRRAVWSYMPGRYNACEECVPRGCSCTMESLDGDYENQDASNWEYQLDEKGRKVPCCEWWSIDNPPTIVWTSPDLKDTTK